MIETVFSSLLEILIGLVVLVAAYEIFASDWVNETRSNWLESKSKSNNCEKIAKVKLVSNDVKAVENFVTNNAQFLSTETVNALAAHIQELNAQNLLDEYDEDLKNRISQAGQATIAASEQAEEISEPAPKKKRLIRH